MSEIMISEEEVMELFEDVMKDMRNLFSRSSSGKGAYYIPNNKIGTLRYFLGERIKLMDKYKK